MWYSSVPYSLLINQHQPLQALAIILIMDDFKLTEFTDSFFSQTYSFDAQQVCYAPNHRIDGVKLEDACKIDWNPNGTVRAYGPIERGQFEGNPDIAGLGVGFIVPSALLDTNVHAKLAFRLLCCWTDHEPFRYRFHVLGIF